MTQACDLTDPASRAALFERIRAEGLRFWALINVAGIDYEGPFYEQTRQQIRTIIRLNIEGTLEMTHALLEFRDPLTPFRIINVASLAAFYPMPVKATYAASKRFLLDFSLALREEVRELGATVTVLCPAGLPTTPRMHPGHRSPGLDRADHHPGHRPGGGPDAGRRPARASGGDPRAGQPGRAKPRVPGAHLACRQPDRPPVEIRARETRPGPPGRELRRGHRPAGSSSI